MTALPSKSFNGFYAGDSGLTPAFTMTSRKTMRSAFFAVFVFLLLSTHGLAQEQLLKDRFLGKMFVIRNFYSESRLHYDESGHIEHSVPKGDWRSAQFRVEKVKASAAEFELSGSRLALVYDQKKDKETFVNLGGMEIKVDLPAAAITESKLEELIREIFVSLKKEPDTVPAYWRDLVSGNVETEIGKDGKRSYGLEDIPRRDPALPSDAVQIRTRTSQGIPVYGAGGKVKPPIPIRMPDPEYSERARSRRYQGTMLMRLTITEEGKVEDIRILRPLGLELDERAAAAVKTWTFAPATLDGKPVKAMANIEVTFRLR